MLRRRAASVVIAAGLTAGGFLPVSVALGSAAEAAPYQTLHVGVRNAQVTYVQQQLHVRTTGYYGGETRAAVINFQRWFHLRINGTVDAATMNKIKQVQRVVAARAAAKRRQVVRRPVPALGIRAVSVAASQRGKPYVFGATGPGAFDCSGFTRYVYSRLGKNLPRNTYQQYAATKIGRVPLQVGDLIFSSDLGHVGIYAGMGVMWDAPHTGARVRLEKVWDPHYKVGRVR
jgi:cell wall-associated NlpC family hydrolase